VTELGIGTAYEGRSATIGSLSAALKTTLAPETRTRASAVAGTIRTDGADGGRDAVDRRDQPRQPGKAAGVCVKRAG
jgi:hypothetical protein